MFIFEKINILQINSSILGSKISPGINTGKSIFSNQQKLNASVLVL